MMSRRALLKFWQQPTPPGNVPRTFVFPTWRSYALAEVIEGLGIPRDARILEVGCNVGRNLNYLAGLGYTRLAGVEISPHAVALLRDTYPALEWVPIYLGAAEKVLPCLHGPYDLIFTMAVLEHIHPDSTGVFDYLARLADVLLAIEPTEGHASRRQYPHDLQAIFEERGMTLVSAQEPVADLLDYAALVFRKGP